MMNQFIRANLFLINELLGIQSCCLERGWTCRSCVSGFQWQSKARTSKRFAFSSLLASEGDIKYFEFPNTVITNQPSCATSASKSSFDKRCIKPSFETRETRQTPSHSFIQFIIFIHFHSSRLSGTLIQRRGPKAS